MDNLILKSVTPLEHWYVENLTNDSFNLQDVYKRQPYIFPLMSK